MKSFEKTIDGLLIRDEEALRLPICHRLSLGAFVCESVVVLYSDYFQERYKQREACRIAWELAEGGNVERSLCKKLATQIANRIPKAEEEGYSLDQVLMGAHLLYEYVEQDAKNITSALSSAASSLSFHNLHVQGCNMPDNRIPLDYLTKLDIPVLQMARSAFERLETADKPTITKAFFDGIALDTSFQPLSEAVLKRIKTKPPIHERRGGIVL